MSEEKNTAVTKTPNSKSKKSLKDVNIPTGLAIVILCSVVLVLSLILFGPKLIKSFTTPANVGTTFAEQPSPEAINVEVLPQKIRSFDEDFSNPFLNENLTNVELTGIVKNSAGKSTAIIQTETDSFIVNEGDQLPESEWQVEEIGSDFITFSLTNRTKTIKMKS